MKYTIPYDDKITLPHVKNISTIGVNTNNITYDKKELNGEVVVTGEYSLDDSADVMEFSHDIPISFLIDDEEISPQIRINNFKHELIPGRGIEIMFDLDVLLQTENEVVSREENNNEQAEAEEIKEFQNKIDNNLDAVLNNNREEVKETAQTDDTLDEEEPEVSEVQNGETQDDNEPEVNEVQNEAEMPKEEDKLNTIVSSTATSFDTSFVPREHDRFTTYKIILLEGDEDVDSVLQARNLSKASICSEYTSDKKIILKIEHD